MQRHGWVVALTIVFLIGISCPLASYGQGGNAALNGRVTDPNGLAIGGAKVDAQNVSTDGLSSTVSSEAGLYNFPSLLPGIYRITVTKDGFTQYVRAAFELHAADAASLNVALQIGSVSQTVTVEGSATTVNTTNSSLGGLVDDQQISELPLNGRNYIDLSLMQVGISEKVIGGSSGMAGTWFSSNGAPTQSNNYTLDGAPMVNGRGGVSGSVSGNTLGVDGIKEYKLVTNSFGAEYGMSMGSQMVIVSKGGANRWAGDVFEYIRNDALDARNYFDTPAGSPGRRLPPYRRNNFGASFGGPIRKDKTFFYGVFEEVKQQIGFTANDTYLPAQCHNITAQGDGTYRFNTPADATACNSGATGLTTSTIIPAKIIPFLKLYPNPNVPGSTTQWTQPFNESQRGVFGQMRVDQNFGTSDAAFVRYTIDDAVFDNPTGVAVSFTGTASPWLKTVGTSRNQFLTVSENHIFTPALLNTARLSFSRTAYTVGYRWTPELSAPGLQLVPGAPVLGGFSIGGGFTGQGVGLSQGPPDVGQILNTLSFGDDVFYTHGRHSLKFGTLINHFENGLSFQLYPMGQLAFTSVQTFFEGRASSFTAQLHPGQSFENYNHDHAYYTLGFYLQDDWRTTSRLTLNLGLRYEFNTTVNDKTGRTNYFADIRSSPTSTVGSAFSNPSLKNFSPRIGFAYDPRGKGDMSIRGGFGIYYDIGNYGGPLTQQGYGMPPRTGFALVTNPGTGVDFTLPLTFDQSKVAVSMQTSDHFIQQPYVMQYNLTLDTKMPFGMGLVMSYVGSRGIHLWTQGQDGNPTIPTAVVNGVQYWSNLIPAQTFVGTVPVAGSGCAFILPTCRQNPNISRVNLDATNADSNYNGFQVAVNRRLAKGLQFQSAYTWSHALDTTGGQLGPADCGGAGMAFRMATPNPQDTYGPSCSDLRHNWRFNLLYHFPNIRSTNFAAKMLHGWWVGNIVSFRTGYAFNPTTANRSQSANNGNTGDYPNINTAASIAANPCTSFPGQTASGVNPCAYTPIPFDPDSVITGNPKQWFNPAMFSLQPMVPCPNNAALTCGTLGNVSRGLLRGPGGRNWDFSVVKDTRLPFLGENGTVQFRAEFFNFLNHPTFSYPAGGAFTGSTIVKTPYAQAPSGTAGQITSTVNTSRQVQLALKIAF